MSIKLLHNLVAVRPDEAPEVSKGGIVLTSQDRPTMGEVVAVGPGVYNPKGNFIPVTVEVGDKVVYSKGAGRQYEVDGEELTIINEMEVVGIIR